MKTIVRTWEVSDEAFSLLMEINEKGRAEYRDNRYPTLEEYMAQEGRAEFQTERHYLARNFGGTYHLTDQLIAADLIDDGDQMDMHVAYYITEFGKEQLKKLG